MTTPYIITHFRPDMDAVMSTWLLKRYIPDLHGATVLFENVADPDPDTLHYANAVCDLGKEYDPTRLRFDHHHDGNLPCATLLVYQHLLDQGYFSAIEHLAPLIDLINAHDVGGRHDWGEASRSIGIHAIYASGCRDRNDDECLAWGYQLLDGLSVVFRDRLEAYTLTSMHMVYQSNDGLLVGLLNAPRSCSGVAFDRGARLVVFANTDTNAIGCVRASEWSTLHVGNLVQSIIDEAIPLDDITQEMERWFQHPVGFFAGRGTDKGPSNVPILVDVADVCKRIDEQWQR